MLKKTITYTDFNGVERTEDFYFNLTKAELAEMALTADGDLKERLEAIIAAKNQSEIIKEFKKIILLSYGEKSADGRYFEKSKEISERFSHTEAYSILFMELATNADKASEFVNAILPQVKK